MTPKDRLDYAHNKATPVATYDDASYFAVRAQMLDEPQANRKSIFLW